MKKIDVLDEKLINMLQADARRSSGALARRLDVSAATVRRRTRLLIKKGVIRIAAVPDPAKIGYKLTAVIAIRVKRKQLDAVLEALRTRPELESIFTITGRFDILAVAHFRLQQEFTDFIQSELPRIAGVEDTETFICLDTVRGKQ